MGPEAVQRILDLLDDVESKMQSLTDKINDILSWVPWGLGWVVDKFMDLWDKVLEKLGEFWDKVAEFVSNIGQPWDLNAAKDEWIGVGGPVAARAVEASRSQSTVDFEWKGRAADRYAMALPEQQRAITGVRDKLTSVVGPALGDIATALYVFFAAVAGALVILVAAIVTATGEAVSILGLPAVPPTVIAAIAAALVAIGAAINNLLGAARDANTTFLDLQNARSDFGAQNWPPAVVG